MNDFDNKQICSYKDIDRFGFTCDVCGRKVNGCHYINGMSFCEKCYKETFGKDNQQNEIQQLKQQLAEKDKEIERLNTIKNNAIECADLFKVALSVRQKDLAIQELEKVKVNLKDRISMMKNKEHSYLQKVVAWYAICDQINQQIKELKGEKDDRT